MLRRFTGKIPMFLAFQVLMASREHWNSLNPVDRRRALDLLRKSHGDPRQLSPDERREARELLRRLEMGRYARRVGPIAWKGRRRTRI